MLHFGVVSWCFACLCVRRLSQMTRKHLFCGTTGFSFILQLGSQCTVTQVEFRRRLYMPLSSSDNINAFNFRSMPAGMESAQSWTILRKYNYEIHSHENIPSFWIGIFPWMASNSRNEGSEVSSHLTQFYEHLSGLYPPCNMPPPSTLDCPD